MIGLMAVDSKTKIVEAEKTEVGANSMQRSAMSNYNAKWKLIS